MVIKDIERSDVEFICEVTVLAILLNLFHIYSNFQSLGCTPIADAKAFDAKKLGQAKVPIYLILVFELTFTAC